MKLIITETIGKDNKPLFYIREQPYNPGYSIQATASSMEGAEWILSRLLPKS